MKQTMAVSFPGGKKVDVDLGNVKIKTDQPATHGGDGSAPEPFDLFLASLASCAGIYALGFFQSRNMSVDDLSFHLDWETEDTPPHAAKAIFRLTLPPEFPEKYRPSIIRAIEMCTVKRYLNNPPEFRIELK